MSKASVEVKVWDIPTRLFHWSLVVLMGLLWWSGENGEMELHQIFAYSLASILIFRVIWGLIGSDSARFGQFIVHPVKTLKYLSQLKRKNAPEYAGHNPVGGYMVIALLLIVSFQLVTGLFTTDDIFTEGPLYSYVSSEASDVLTWLHKNTFNVILGLVVLHVLAVVIHTLKGENLVPAMLHGKKKMLQQPEKVLGFRSSFLGLGILAIIVGLMGYYLIWPLINEIL
ncbi:cytochrome b/b6 domain-containing protein [Parashewanella tropica]|uniref:cytochrome b/b6 domain-containing protein n=1 Tax=Parashewanella tropica TaxID=2547970 RepID=UPI00105A2E97|nr:cytochrome b/b6 domain-containing protein [Parashewanella tropica]